MRGVVAGGGGWWCLNEHFISILSIAPNGNVHFGLDAVINFTHSYLIPNMMTLFIYLFIVVFESFLICFFNLFL